MNQELPAIDFQRFWRRLQQIGLNAYEARAYLVLVGHPRFKALELAARAHVPRQKIYEVLDGLVEKGFAQVVQEKTKLFSAVEPDIAVPSHLARKRQQLEHELTAQSRLAAGFMEDLKSAYAEGQGGRGTLDFLQIVCDPNQTAIQYRRMLAEVRNEYVEFMRRPFAIEPFESDLVREATTRGVSCRLLVDSASLDRALRGRLVEVVPDGVEVREAPALPLKLALFDGHEGLVALLDPVITKPTWTSLRFDHFGFGEAMKALFEERWRRAEPVTRRS